jgi:hypothetical protein
MSRRTAALAPISAIAFSVILIGIQLARVILNARETGSSVVRAIAEFAAVAGVIIVVAVALLALVALPAYRRSRTLLSAGSADAATTVYSIWRNPELVLAIDALTASGERRPSEGIGLDPIFTLSVHDGAAHVWCGDREPFQKLATISHLTDSDVSFGERYVGWAYRDTLVLEVPNTDGKVLTMELVLALPGFRSFRVLNRSALERVRDELLGHEVPNVGTDS